MMRGLSRLMVAGLLLAGGLTGPRSDLQAAEPIPLLDFAAPREASGLPAGWQLRHFRTAKSRTRYSVVDLEGEPAIRAEAVSAHAALYREFRFDPGRLPILTWRWRVENLLRGGDGGSAATDDFPARLLVLFGSRASKPLRGALDLLPMPERLISYVWASRLPLGTIQNVPRISGSVNVVVESGPARLKRWVTVVRDLREDYRRCFEGEASPVTGIALVTDTDDTGESAVAYYGPIFLSPR